MLALTNTLRHFQRTCAHSHLQLYSASEVVAAMLQKSATKSAELFGALQDFLRLVWRLHITYVTEVLERAEQFHALFYPRKALDSNDWNQADSAGSCTSHLYGMHTFDRLRISFHSIALISSS